MTTFRMAQPGDLIIDNSFSPPTQDQLRAGRALGVVGNMRYTSEPVGRDKNLTYVQALEGWQVGVGALANQEQTHLDSHEGYNGGLRRARSFLAVARAIGYPETVPAIVSVDTGWHATALDFVRAFDFSLRSEGWQQVGTYFFGPGPAEQLTQAGFGHDVLWQAHAGSYFTTFLAAQRVADQLDAVVRKCPNRPGWEVISNLAHLYQEFGYVRLADGPFRPGQIDENHVRRPVRMWFPAQFPGNTRPIPPAPPRPTPDPTPDPTPTPSPEEDDMPTRYLHTDGRQFILAPDGRSKIHVTAEPWAVLAEAGGSVMVTDATNPRCTELLDMLPDADPRSVAELAHIVNQTTRDAQKVVQAQVIGTVDQMLGRLAAEATSIEEKIADAIRILQAAVAAGDSHTLTTASALLRALETALVKAIAEIKPGSGGGTGPLKLVIDARVAGPDE